MQPAHSHSGSRKLSSELDAVLAVVEVGAQEARNACLSLKARPARAREQVEKSEGRRRREKKTREERRPHSFLLSLVAGLPSFALYAYFMQISDTSYQSEREHSLAFYWNWDEDADEEKEE